MNPETVGKRVFPIPESTDLSSAAIEKKKSEIVRIFKYKNPLFTAFSLPFKSMDKSGLTENKSNTKKIIFTEKSIIKVLETHCFILLNFLAP